MAKEAFSVCAWNRTAILCEKKTRMRTFDTRTNFLYQVSSLGRSDIDFKKLPVSEGFAMYWNMWGLPSARPSLIFHSSSTAPSILLATSLSSCSCHGTQLRAWWVAQLSTAVDVCELARNVPCVASSAGCLNNACITSSLSAVGPVHGSHLTW